MPRQSNPCVSFHDILAFYLAFLRSKADISLVLQKKVLSC